jgi:hypothetical protein
MNSEKVALGSKLLPRIAMLPDGLGPFKPDTPRENKWRTTEQLANELELFGRVEIDQSTRFCASMRLSTPSPD